MQTQLIVRFLLIYARIPIEVSPRRWLIISMRPRICIYNQTMLTTFVAVTALTNGPLINLINTPIMDGTTFKLLTLEVLMVCLHYSLPVISSLTSV
jgi:hypothetical protein